MDLDKRKCFMYAKIGDYRHLEEELRKDSALAYEKDEYKNTLLHYTLIHGYEKCMELLLASGADVNACNSDGRTPLHMMVQYCTRIDIIGTLLKNGARIDIRDRYGNLPLSLASSFIHNKYFAWGNHKAVSDYLIHHGSGIDAFSAAAMNKKIELNQALQSTDVNTCQSHACMVNNSSLLHIASERGYDDLVEVLLLKNADMYCTDSRGRIPFYLASHRDSPRRMKENDETCKKFLDYGLAKDIFVKALLGDDEAIGNESYDMVMARDKGGNTPLHLAAWNGNTAVVERLLKMGADIDAKNKSGQTPVELALKYYKYDTAEVLVENNAGMNIFSAVSYGDENLIKHIAEKDKHLLNCENRYHRTPLQICVEMAENNTKGHYWCGREGKWNNVRLLLELGAELDPCTAARLGMFNELKVWLDSGNRNKGIHDNMNSIMHFAVSGGNTDVMELLYESGYLITERNIMGREPVWNTLDSENTVNSSALEWLLIHGADTDSKDNWGYSFNSYLQLHSKKQRRPDDGKGQCNIKE